MDIDDESVEISTTMRGASAAARTKLPRRSTSDAHLREARRAHPDPDQSGVCRARARGGTARTSHRRGYLDILTFCIHRTARITTLVATSVRR